MFLNILFWKKNQEILQNAFASIIVIRAKARLEYECMTEIPVEV